MLEREPIEEVERDANLFGRWVSMRVDLEKQRQAGYKNPTTPILVFEEIARGAYTLDILLAKHPRRVRAYGTDVEGQVHVGLRMLTDILDEIRLDNELA